MDTIVDVINYTAPSTEVCLIQGRNKTIVITDLYEGIPQTLILNIIAWLILILLFTILRQQAWDYGRLALVNNCYTDNKRWTQLFYAHGNELDAGGTNHDTRSIISNSSGGGGGGGGGNNSTTGSIGNRISNHRGSGSGTGDGSGDGMNRGGGGGGGDIIGASIDRGLFSWLWVTIKLKKENILMHSGPDAVHYLSFQQHLMVVMAIITFISIVIILPVNFQGTLIPGVNSFGHTTISNLAPDSTLLWIHVIVAIIYVPLVVLVMRRSSGRNAFKTAPTRTIMATNISRSDCNKATIRNYLQELFPDRQFEDIELAYNITKLTELVNEYERVISARIYCEMHRTRDKIYATTNCWTCKTIDALEYYQEKEQQLQGEVARLRASALNSPLGIAFITVSSMEAAQDIIMHFRPGTYREWTLTYAPAPSDLFWENLSVGASRWYVKWVIVNFCLFLFLFFLTTPVYIVNMLGVISQQVGKVSPLVSEFLPTLMLWTLAALMPVIVSFSDKWLSHWTRSKQNYSIMTKSFGYLLFMILILPSLGLTSAQALLEWTFHYDDNEKYRWDCIFLPDKGAFFVNYVITAAFIGTALELLRFPDLIVYIWMLCTAKSRAETTHVRKSILIEFPFGIHYAWTIMVFTMSTVYSIACPLIMPFAMVYIILKHFGDRHNLYFAYGPSNMISQGGGKIHSTAVTMTKVSTVLLLIILAALATVRKGGIDPRAIVLLLSLFVTLTLFTFMSPIKKCTTKRPSICELQGPAPIYVADVLLNRRVFQSGTENNNNNNNNHTSISHLGYGSDTPAAVDLEAYITEDVPIRNVFT